MDGGANSSQLEIDEVNIDELAGFLEKNMHYYETMEVFAVIYIIFEHHVVLPAIAVDNRGMRALVLEILVEDVAGVIDEFLEVLDDFWIVD